MQKEEQQATIPSPEDLKALVQTAGPCITILLGVHKTEQRNRQELVRLRNAIQAVTQDLTAKKMSPSVIRDLMGPIEELVEDTDLRPGDCGTFAILRSPAVFRTFTLREESRDAAIVDDHFYILPLLRALENRRSFYILALSQRHPRLLHCTEDHSEEVALPAGMPKSVDEWLSTRTPEGSNDQSVQKGGEFTSPTDRDNFNEHLLNYFRVLDKGIVDLIRDTSKPLVLAGVEKELSLFRSISSYSHLAAQDVHGAPDGLKGGEMHKRALEVVQSEFEKALGKALADFERLGGTNRTATDFPVIAKAAREGRIAQLLIGDTGGEQQDHTINDAAVETIAHSGIVMVVEPEKVPAASRVAAILRY